MRNLLLRRFSCAGSLLLFLLLHGCWAISDPDMWPRNFVQKDALPALVGKRRDEVVDALGPPTFVISNNGAVSYIYQRLEGDVWVLMVGYFPAGGGSETEASCILIKFDERGVFSVFETEHTGAVLDSGKYETGVSDCRGVFPVDDSDTITAWLLTADGQQWADTVNSEVLFEHYRRNPRDEGNYQWLCYAAHKGHPAALAEVRRLYWHSARASADESIPQDDLAEAKAIFAMWGLDQCERQLLKEQNYPNSLKWIVRGASKGNVSDMMKLYWATPTGPSATKWLCRAADLGDANAQSRVGLLYTQGREGLHRDNLKAYVYYRLSASHGFQDAEEKAMQIHKSLTDQQSIQVEEALKSWQSGQCLRDLLEMDH